jgi:hypothetical protein
MSDQTPIQPAATVPAPVVPDPATPTPGVSLLTTIIVSAVLSAFSGTVAWHFASKSLAAHQQVVVIDAAKIAEARLKLSLSKPLAGPEGAAKEGQDFMRQFNAAIDSYSENGVVVINSSVTLNRPAGLDVTDAVASRLGVELH